MNKIILIGLIISISSNIYSNESALVKRYAIFVGANNGGDNRAILRYAESDAIMVSKVFYDIGGIESDNSLLLLNPTETTLKRTFQNISNRIVKNDKTTRTELIFYYSGHSTEEGLLLNDSLYSYSVLKKALEDTKADVKIGILDSCSSGAFTLLKGGKHSSAFLVDESTKTTGHAFITSSSENESAQESNRLQASFFTHFLVSALRGAADTSLDGKVSLHEAYSYASNETLARTETTQAGPQHASYDFRLSGSGDLVLTDLRDADSQLEFLEDDFGRFFIRDRNDNLISEVNKKYGSKLKISVPSSSYKIIKELDGIYYTQNINLSLGDDKMVVMSNYRKFIPESNIVRGGKSNLIEYDLNVPEATAIFGWSTMDKIRELKSDINIISKAGSLEGVQLSLANMVINDAYGAQLSTLFNVNGGDFSGIQLSGLFNITGGNIENYGFQFSGLYNWVSKGSDSLTIQSASLFNNIGSDTEGPIFQLSAIYNNIGGNTHSFSSQTSALFNKSRNFTGVQFAGIFNNSRDISGLQIASLFNNADDVKGIQISLVNCADFVNGSQIGLVNINKDIKGLSIGLINISTEGIKNFNYRYNGTTNENTIDYQFGSSIIYHQIYLTLPTDISNITNLGLGAGFGVHIPIGSLYTEFDASLNNKLLSSSSGNFEYEGGYPNLSGKIALPLWDDFALFAGINLEFPKIITENGSIYSLNGDLSLIERTFFIGFRI